MSSNEHTELQPVASRSSTDYDQWKLSSAEQGASSGEANDDLDEHLPFKQAIRRYPKIIAYCLALTVTIVGWGYNLVVVGSVTGVDSFKESFGSPFEGKLIIPSLWLSFWLAFPPAGAAIGSVSSGWLQDRIGRKYTLMVGSIISAIAIALIFFSYLPEGQDNKRAMFTVGLTVQGLSVGFIKVTALTYVSENVPSSLRGSAMALFPTFTLLGQLIGSIVVYGINNIQGPTGYLGAFASQWALALAPFILSCIMPESPAYFVRRGEDAAAMRSATRLYAPRVDPYRALAKIRHTIEEERAVAAKISYSTCFKGTHLRRTLITILAATFPAMFGLDQLSNASYFLQTLDMASSPSLMFMIGGIIAGMVANGTGIWILTRVGRRTVSLVTMAIAALLWGVMGISGFWSGTAVAYVSAGAMIGVIVVCGMGCWPASYAIVGETSSLQMRSKTQALGNVTAQSSSIAMSAALPYIFNPDAGALGAKTGFIYVGLCTLGVILAWFWLPEMKGRSTIELDQMFEMKLPTRKFKSFIVNVDDREVTSPLAKVWTSSS